MTQHYLNEAYGGKQGCEQAQNPKTAATSLRVQNTLPAGGKGRPIAVTVIPSGGIYDGEKLVVSVVEENGTWKVDGIKSNAPVGP